MARTYQIEIIFFSNIKPRWLARVFKTQKAARVWCEKNGFTPIFGGARPSMFWSGKTRNGHHGMQATIYETGHMFWLDSSTEGKTRDKIARAAR